MGTNDCEVLVVEDDRFIRESVVAALQAWGFTVASVADGAEALAHLATTPPDLVLLDLRMPVVDGRAFVRAVRDQGAPVKFLVMSAAGDGAEAAAELDAAGWLDKPFSVPTLIAEVKRLCAD